MSFRTWVDLKPPPFENLFDFELGKFDSLESLAAASRWWQPSRVYSADPRLLLDLLTIWDKNWNFGPDEHWEVGLFEPNSTKLLFSLCHPTLEEVTTALNGLPKVNWP